AGLVGHGRAVGQGNTFGLQRHDVFEKHDPLSDFRDVLAPLGIPREALEQARNPYGHGALEIAARHLYPALQLAPGFVGNELGELKAYAADRKLSLGYEQGTAAVSCLL